MMNLDPLSIWLFAGIILLIGEMLSASFFLIFISIGCFAAAMAASLHAPVWSQVVICAVISVLGTLTLRKAIQKKLLQTISLQADVGREIRVDEAIAPHQQTRITYQGTSWLATNLGTEDIRQGDHVVIVGIDGNVLLIRKMN